VGAPCFSRGSDASASRTESQLHRSGFSPGFRCRCVRFRNPAAKPEENSPPGAARLESRTPPHECGGSHQCIRPYPTKKGRPYLPPKGVPDMGVTAFSLPALAEQLLLRRLSPLKSRLVALPPCSREAKMLREVVSRSKPSHRASASMWPDRRARPTWTWQPSGRRYALHLFWPSWAGF
jgi:hypothetical protein